MKFTEELNKIRKRYSLLYEALENKLNDRLEVENYDSKRVDRIS